MAIPKRCVGSKVCVLQFPIFSCAHLGSSARELSKRPQWSTYLESEVIGVKSLCSEGLVDYSIQAEDIRIYICAPFKALLGVFSPILLFFARHDVKWRPCISTLRSIDIMTQVCSEGTYFGAHHILNPANNSSWAWHTVAAMLTIWDHPMGSLGDPAIPKTGGVGRRPKDMLDTYDLIPILWLTPVQVGHVPHLPQP